MFAVWPPRLFLRGKKKKKKESSITGEYPYECYYRWHYGRSSAFWHLALITDVPHVRKAKHIHAQCYILMFLQRKAGAFLTAREQGQERWHAQFPFSPVHGHCVPVGGNRRARRMIKGDSELSRASNRKQRSCTLGPEAHVCQLFL